MYSNLINSSGYNVRRDFQLVVFKFDYKKATTINKGNEHTCVIHII